MMLGYETVVMGVSQGGLKALNRILPEMAEDFLPPIVIVQHMAPFSDDYLACSLNEKCALRVKEAQDNEPMAESTVYIAPADYHLQIEEDRTFSLSSDPHVKYARPAIDVLFETAAEAIGGALIGVLLTGSSSDGSQGMRCIQNEGGLTIVQDPATAESSIMPQSAIELIKVDYILPLEEIAPMLMRIVRLGRASADNSPEGQ